MSKFLAALTFLFFLLGGTALAQTTDSTAASDGESGVVASGSIEIVDVDLSSYGSDGTVLMVAALKGLSSELDLDQLVVTQNGEVIQDAQFRIGEFPSTPAFVALAIDTSGSMDAPRLNAAKAAAVQFVERKAANDFVALVTFDDEATVVREFSADPSTMIEAINALSSGNATAMFDGVIAATDLFSAAPFDVRRYMIILTDGEPSGGVATVDEAIAAVQREGVQTFGVAIQSGDTDTTDLEAIVAAGNGQYRETADPEDLSALYDQFQQELNRAILIGFESSIADPGQVEFGISYGDLATTVSESVPGFSSATTRPLQTTTSTAFQLAQAEPHVVTYDLPIDLNTLLLLAVIGIGGAVFLFLFILAGSDSDGAGRFSKRLAAYGRRGGGGLVEERRPFLERIPLLNRFTAAAEEQVRKRGLLGAVNATLEQGNIPLSAGEAIAAGIGLSAVFGLISGVLSLNWIVGLVTFGVAVLIVFGAINFIGGREKRKFENQLPDTLTLLSTSLRAGYSLLQAVEAVAQEAPNPTAREFGRAIAEARLGRQVTEALDGITQRTQSKDFEWAVMAIDIQREVGGNLAEVLQTVADTMLARNRLRGEIKALTAEGRISAIVLGALPFAIGLFLQLSNPDYLRPLFASPAGLVAIGVGGATMLAGILWLRKIVNIEV